MDVPYSTIFVGLLLVYLVYSVWARLDGRYPIGAALVLLVATAVVDAAGNVDTANTLAEYVFFLLAGGVVLLVIEQVRDRRTTPTASGSPVAERVSSDTPQEGKGPADQSLDGLEEQPVPVIDGAGYDHGSQEQERDPEPEHRQSEQGYVGLQERQSDPDR